jgi:hypothetical protein
MIKLHIKEDYTEYPGLRYIDISINSGEDFYHSLLNKKFYEALSQEKKLELNFDGVAGYPPSFLDESIGNLVYDFGLESVQNNLEIISNEEPSWVKFLEEGTYKEWDNRRKNNKPPKITAKHDPWYRRENGRLEQKEWIKFD